MDRDARQKRNSANLARRKSKLKQPPDKLLTQKN